MEASTVKYRVLDLINSVYVVGNPEDEAYSLQDANYLVTQKVTNAIETGRTVNYAIVDESGRAVMHIAVNVFPG